MELQLMVSATSIHCPRVAAVERLGIQPALLPEARVAMQASDRQVVAAVPPRTVQTQVQAATAATDYSSLFIGNNMLERYAIVENNVVTNIILWDSDHGELQTTALAMKNNSTSIGDWWEESEQRFYRPLPRNDEMEYPEEVSSDLP
jgi:hypothetical protein